MLSNPTIDSIRTFVAERDWSQFHTPANLAKSISIEAGELLECFQWSDEPRNNDITHVQEELADVLIYCVMLADRLNVDLDTIVNDKLAKNTRRYPVETAYGNSDKTSVN